MIIWLNTKQTPERYWTDETFIWIEVFFTLLSGLNNELKVRTVFEGQGRYLLSMWIRSILNFD